MTRAKLALIVLTLSLVGAWGCSSSQTPGPSSADRLKALEVKNAKLEDDFRAVAAARDQMRRKLAAAEEQQQQLQKHIDEMQTVTRERDELRTLLTQRTVERDNLVNQYDQFRKGLRELLGQADAALPQVSDPLTATVDAETATPGKS